jgi:L-aminopeptidase/D-esterase-like protein
MRQIRFNEIEGIRVGHTEDLKAATGATIIISEEGATVGMDVRGGAPGTRETDLLDPVNLVDKVHAILLAGGSAFGLDAAAGAIPMAGAQSSRYTAAIRSGADSLLKSCELANSPGRISRKYSE